MSSGTIAPAVDWNDRLAAARPQEFAELFHEALTDDFGAVARLHQMLGTASEWCRAHAARSSASELDALADRLTDLGEGCISWERTWATKSTPARIERQQRPASPQPCQSGALPSSSRARLLPTSHRPPSVRCRLRGEHRHRNEDQPCPLLPLPMKTSHRRPPIT
ncbi:hypothetical protein ACFWNG_27045 [Streptomyces sp. NPDC058391]|uniref:hypothetical protein n=1 Tax=Streptomyces sp. NPDC058391 TaxID=3346476 RepID=UPI00364E4321